MVAHRNNDAFRDSLTRKEKKRDLRAIADGDDHNRVWRLALATCRRGIHYRDTTFDVVTAA
jgi:hypothetical protein